MASLPATTQMSPDGAAIAPPPSNNLMQGFSGVGIFRQIGLLVGLTASIAIGFAVVLWSQEPDYSPLLTNMQNVDANQAVDLLRANEIPFKIDSRGGGLLVSTEHLHTARMKLAAVGIAENRNVGFELLDKEQGLGTSQFMENISYRRGLEGELARTIASLQSVRAARVHLGLPKATVFVRDARKPSASVFVDLMSGRALRDEQVNAITNLVASSVPQLDPMDVTIVDQSGRLLSKQGETEDVAMAAHQFEYTRKLEAVLNGRIEGILLPVVGADKFRTELSADVDFTAQEETQEAYNPELQVLRSEQTMEEQRSGLAGAGGVPGALSNQPAGGASVPELAAGGEAATATGATTAQNRRTQATRNYELDRKISHTKYQQGQIRRLSVAVVIDNIIPAGGDEAAPWAEADIERLTNLVKGAVGFDETRGDIVTVINAPFIPIEVVVPEVIETPIWQQPWFMKLAKQGLAALLVLLLVFVVIRPIMKSLANNGQQQKALVEATARAEAAAQQAMATGGPQAAAMAGQQSAQLPGSAAAMLPGPGSNGMSLSTVQGMIDSDPQRAAQVVKQWVNDNE